MRRFAVLLLFTLAGCGGAASSPHVAGNSAAGGTPIAYGTLTLKFPANTKVATRSSSAKSRLPKYVSPNGSIVKIWVGGQYTGTPVAISPAADGTQTIPNIPLYSGTTDVTAVEYDASADVLAVGESPAVSVTAGQAATITVNMLMNATGFAISFSSDGSNAAEMTGGYVNTSNGPGTAFVFPTDPSGTFVGAAPPVGVGGLPTNTFVAIAPDTSGATIAQASVGYSFTLTGASDGVTLAAIATNPAAAAVSNASAYPVLNGLVSSFKNPLPANALAPPTNVVPTGYLIPAGYVWVTNNSGNGGVLAWPVGASGNVAPIVNLSGSRTTLHGAVALAFDSNGDIYAANDSGTGLALFGPIANGNEPPLLSFTSTTPVETEGISVDTSGNMYVASYQGNPNAVAVFSPGASGNAAPTRFISGPNTQLQLPIGLALDSNGNIYVADAFADAVIEFAANANGNASPIAVISGPATDFLRPTTIAIGPSNQIVVGDEDADAVYVFSAGANGNVAPVQAISGAATGIQVVSGVALDSTNHVWASDATANSVSRWAPGANGNVAPIQVIQGAATLMDDPQNVHVP